MRGPMNVRRTATFFIFYNSVVLFVGPRRLFTKRKKKDRLQRDGKFINYVERSVVQ